MSHEAFIINFVLRILPILKWFWFLKKKVFGSNYVSFAPQVLLFYEF